MTSGFKALRREAGFTIIEVMVAITLLLIGVLGVATMADSANIMSTTTKARVGATNLARELVEDARTFKYAELNGSLPAGTGPTDLEDAYANIGVTDGSPTLADTQISRRGTTYTVHVFTCIVDDAHDGVRATATPDVNAAGTPYCSGSAASAGAATDSNPDDARKVEVSVTWSLGNRPIPPQCANTQQTTGIATGGIGRACVVQSELIANPTGGLGPAIKSITQTNPAAPNTTIEPGNTAVTLRVETTFGAESVTWVADDGSNGSATAAPGDATGTLWDITWGSWGTATPIDGSHIVTVQAFLFNAGGVPKEAPVNFNRFIPQAPAQASLKGGVDTRISGQPAAAINWLPVTGNDILGYTVYRAKAAVPVLVGLPAVRDTPVCSTASVTATNCFDAPGASPTDLASFTTPCVPPENVLHQCISYYVVPFDEKWKVASDDLLRNAVTCLPFPYATDVTVPNPPDSVPPLTSSAGWPNARAGCPSSLLTVDVTAGTDPSTNPQPDPATGGTCSTDTGQPVIGWTPPSNPGNLTSYRIYRDPLTDPPGYNASSTTISFGSTSSFKDPNPAGSTGHTYFVTVVNDKFQESAPLKIIWTAACT